MEPFRQLDAVAAPMRVPNVDTDQIIPARFCWRKRGDGWGHLVFHDLRFDDQETPKPDFVLNRDGIPRGAASWWRTATSAAARRASRRCGRSTTTASAP